RRRSIVRGSCWRKCCLLRMTASLGPCQPMSRRGDELENLALAAGQLGHGLGDGPRVAPGRELDDRAPAAITSIAYRRSRGRVACERPAQSLNGSHTSDPAMQTTTGSIRWVTRMVSVPS